MPSWLRSALFLLVAVLATSVLAACGGDDQTSSGEPASSETDVTTLLKETFSGSKQVDSGRLDLSLDIDAKGAEGVEGPIAVKLAGPFQSSGEGRLPKLDLDLAFTGAGQDVKAGATSTGDKAFVNFNGTDYAVSDQVFRQLEAGYEESQKQSTSKPGQTSLATLGIDPTKWLTGAENAGEAKVGDADTVRVTGGIDVPKLLDDLNVALGKASRLGLQNTGQVPQRITEEQKRQVTEAVRSARVEIYSGTEDKILRRMVVAVDIVPPAGSSGTGAQSAAVRLDFSLTDLNEDQEITAPSNTKPFDELLGQLGGLGALGGGSGSSGSGSGSGAANQETLKRYTDCIEDAGSDTAEAQECADLLTP